jgi:hypothetical protein
VRFDGLKADVQETGDLFIGVTLSDQLDYGAFPIRQSRPLPCGTRKEGIQKPFRDLSSEK